MIVRYFARAGIIYVRRGSYSLHQKGLQAMRRFSSFLSSFLALLGVTCSVLGIIGESFKAASVGVVLIFGAGVFATLYLGTGRNPSVPEQRGTYDHD